MSIELVVDTRERELIKLLPDAKVEQLELGDIIYKIEGEIILIIERKTVKDLKASICDGRGREQKMRLLGTTPVNRILYLIEGNLDKPLDDKISGLPVSTLVGSLINTQLRDNIKVYKTLSIKETANYLIKLKKKLESDIDKYFTGSDDIKSSDYASSLKKCKKSNMTPSVWFISQLSLIPQITEKIAEVIVEKYGNLHILMNEYIKNTGTSPG